jgi:hypothetical protein
VLGSDPVDLDQVERRLQERLDALPPLRAELLHVLMLPDFERADRIGEFWRLHRTGVGQCADSLGRPISIRSWLDPPFLGKSGPREPRCGSPLRGFPHS